MAKNICIWGDGLSGAKMYWMNVGADHPMIMGIFFLGGGGVNKALPIENNSKYVALVCGNV